MNFKQYQEQHEADLLSIVKQIGTKKIDAAQCKMIIDYFRAALKMQRMGLECGELFTEEKINTLRTSINSVLNSEYLLNTKDIDALVSELIEMENRKKQIDDKVQDLEKDLAEYLVKFPLPDDTPADWHEAVQLSLSPL